jgi:hypothetical protein
MHFQTVFKTLSRDILKKTEKNSIKQTDYTFTQKINRQQKTTAL